MIKSMASWIVSFLEKHGVVNNNLREVYVYGCDIALYTFLSTLGLLCIGVLLGRLVETAVLISIFYINQSVGGGFHASSHMRCFITMAIGLLSFVATFYFPISAIECATIGYCALVILFYFPLVLHPNKQYLMNKKKTLVSRSRLAVGIQALIFAIILFFTSYNIPIHSVAISLMLCAMSRCVAATQRKYAMQRHSN